MVKVLGAYHGDLHCSLTHEPSGTVFETDAPVDNQGRGESFSPTDLLGASLASCIATIMAIQARGMGFELSPFTFSVTKEMARSGPRRIGQLIITYAMGDDLPAEKRSRLEAVVQACPVHRSLHPEVEVAVTFTWPEA